LGAAEPCRAELLVEIAIDKAVERGIKLCRHLARLMERIDPRDDVTTNAVVANDLVNPLLERGDFLHLPARCLVGRLRATGRVEDAAPRENLFGMLLDRALPRRDQPFEILSPIGTDTRRVLLIGGVDLLDECQA